MNASEILVYGTCVALGDRAVILQGPSGSGKSDLALRFLTMATPPDVLGTPGLGDPAMLVSDDQVIVRCAEGRLFARPPHAIAGKLEVRGVGIIDAPYLKEAELRLMAALTSSDNVPRIPADGRRAVTLLGVSVPLIDLAPFDASTPVKLRLALNRLPPR